MHRGGGDGAHLEPRFRVKWALRNGLKHLNVVSYIENPSTNSRESTLAPPFFFTLHIPLQKHIAHSLGPIQSPADPPAVAADTLAVKDWLDRKDPWSLSSDQKRNQLHFALAMAASRGVWPVLSFAFASAPRSSRRRATGPCCSPRAKSRARWRGVWPHMSATFTFALRSRRRRTMDLWPPAQAK